MGIQWQTCQIKIPDYPKVSTCMGGIQNKYRMLKQIISDTANSNIPLTNIFIPLPDEEKKAETLSHLTRQ